MSAGLRPFWRYYGGKWRAAPRYPRPRHDTIVEPFAGAAGYSLRYPERKVVLVEKYHVVAEVWRYLIGASAAEVRRIPLVDDVRDLPSWVPQGAAWLVGFSLSSGIVSPKRTLSAGARRLRESGRLFYGWSEAARERAASQLDAIRHWRVIEGDYTAAPDIVATWFIDPPYEIAGKHYVHGADGIDFDQLGDWCRLRRGHAIVCESATAAWLPFRSFTTQRNAMSGRSSSEAIWTSEMVQS